MHSVAIIVIEYNQDLIMHVVISQMKQFGEHILNCDHSNESYRAVLSSGAVYYAVLSGSNF